MSLLPIVNLRHFALDSYAKMRMLRLGRLLLIFRPIVWRSAGDSRWYWAQPRDWMQTGWLDDMDRVRRLVEQRGWRLSWR